MEYYITDIKTPKLQLCTATPQHMQRRVNLTNSISSIQMREENHKCLLQHLLSSNSKVHIFPNFQGVLIDGCSTTCHTMVLRTAQDDTGIL